MSGRDEDLMNVYQQKTRGSDQLADPSEISHPRCFVHVSFAQNRFFSSDFPPSH